MTQHQEDADFSEVELVPGLLREERANFKAEDFFDVPQGQIQTIILSFEAVRDFPAFCIPKLAQLSLSLAHSGRKLILSNLGSQVREAIESECPGVFTIAEDTVAEGPPSEANLQMA